MMRRGNVKIILMGCSKFFLFCFVFGRASMCRRRKVVLEYSSCTLAVRKLSDN